LNSSKQPQLPLAAAGQQQNSCTSISMLLDND
jgi:hypothetical protein